MCGVAAKNGLTIRPAGRAHLSLSGFRTAGRIAPAQMTGSQMPPSNFQLAGIAPDRGEVSLIWGYLGMSVLARPALPIGRSRAEIFALFAFGAEGNLPLSEISDRFMLPLGVKGICPFRLLG